MENEGLTMERRGEFTLSTYGDNHCGTLDRLKIRYTLICKCSSVLDTRGFLFDQINVQAYFDSIKRSQLSCERLAVVCLDQLLESILQENPHCQVFRMELTLSPEPFAASMTRHRENPDRSPLRLVPRKGKFIATKKLPVRRVKRFPANALRNLAGPLWEG